MSKKNIAWLISGTFFTITVIVDVVLELLGISSFLFGKRVFSEFLGFFIVFAVLSFTILIFSVLKYKRDFLGEKLRIAIKTFTMFFTVLLVCFGLITFLIMNESKVYKNISHDKRHEVYVETDTVNGGWNVTVYKRYSPLFKVERQSFNIDDMASEDENITVEWFDNGCDISYEHYSDYATSSQPEVFTQRVYFQDKTIE